MLDRSLSVKSELIISAPLEKVWNAIVDPEQVEKYFFGTRVESEWKKGRPIVFSGEWEGKSYKDKGVILDISEGKLLEYSYYSGFSGLTDTPENYSLVRYKLEALKEGIHVCVEQEGFKDQSAWKDSKAGWDMILKGMKELLIN